MDKCPVNLHKVLQEKCSTHFSAWLQCTLCVETSGHRWTQDSRISKWFYSNSGLSWNWCLKLFGCVKFFWLDSLKFLLQKDQTSFQKFKSHTKRMWSWRLHPDLLSFCQRQSRKMQLDVGMKPTFKFEHMICICKEMGIVKFEILLLSSLIFDRRTDRQTDRQMESDAYAGCPQTFRLKNYRIYRTPWAPCIWAHRAIRTGGLNKLSLMISPVMVTSPRSAKRRVYVLKKSFRSVMKLAWIVFPLIWATIMWQAGSSQYIDTWDRFANASLINFPKENCSNHCTLERFP